MRFQLRRGVGIALALLVALALLPASEALSEAPYNNPVIAGDFADPSVVRVGSEYFASATSGEWAPSFPLQRSTDLVNWVVVGALFDQPPMWTAGVYWAPDLSVQDGRFRAYYTARRAGGRPCIGVSTAARAAGPYHDRGPLMCPPRGGAIDPHVAEVAPGRRVLIYKQMGLGAPLRVTDLSPDGLHVARRGVAVLRPDQPWERGVTENPFLVQRPDGWYLFYSGGNCCRPPCSYAVGVARAPTPTGPYTKFAGPILRGNDRFMCPGGGSVVTQPTGDMVLAYHAYDRADPGLGRQMLIDQLTWRPDGWPQVGTGTGPSPTATSTLAAGQRTPQPIADDFGGRGLPPGWHWPFDRRPAYRVGRGLTLHVGPGDQMSTFAARQSPYRAFVATTAVHRDRLRPMSTASLAISRASGDRAIGIGISTSGVTVWRRDELGRGLLAATPLVPAAVVQVRFVVPGDGTIVPQLSLDGATWQDLRPPIVIPGGSDGTRVLLAGRGRRGDAVRFGSLRIDPLGA